MSLSQDEVTGFPGRKHHVVQTEGRTCVLTLVSVALTARVSGQDWSTGVNVRAIGSPTASPSLEAAVDVLSVHRCEVTCSTRRF